MQMDVVAGLGIPASTAYRLLGDMRRVGMLEAVNGRGRHRLSRQFSELGSLADRNRILFSRVEKYFAQLSDDFSETVYLVQMRGRVISLVGYVNPVETIGLHPGNAFPIHASAAGKILWAHQSEDKLDAELKRPHVKFQEKTLVLEEEIRAELQAAKALGFGIHNEEWDEGVLTVAAPLFLGRKIPSMAFGVMAMKDRISKKFTRDEIFQRLYQMRDVIEPKLRDF